MDLIKFFMEAGKLKSIKRAGWAIDGARDSESIADHIFRTALMTMILGSRSKGLDVNKAVKMALVHDLGESQLGDLISKEKIDLKIKRGHDMGPLRQFKKKQGNIGAMTESQARAREEDAIRMLSELVGSEEILSLWKEFEEKKTREAQFVRQIDKLEMALQALEYEKGGNHSSHGLEHYFTSEFGAKPAIKDPELVKIFETIMSMRPKKKG